MSDPAATRANASPDEVVASQRNRQLTVLVAIVTVLAGLVALTRWTSRPDESTREVLLIGGTAEAPAFKKDDVALVRIWRDKAAALDIKRVEGTWRLPSRFDASADKADVESLISKVVDARRWSRPATEEAARFALYRLADDDAVHLALVGADGKELIHLMVGRAEQGSRDFVRLAGAGAPAGMFELTAAGGQFDSLYSRLNLNADDEPDAKRWLDLAGFRVLPLEATAQRVLVVDGDKAMEFRRRHGTEAEKDDWGMSQPRSAEADGAAVRGLVEALGNLSALDVAGRTHPEGPGLGVTDSKRRVEVEYTQDGKAATARVYFGTEKDGNVAVLLKKEDQGALVYWVGKYSMERLFRRPAEFVRRTEVGVLPVGAEASRLVVRDGDRLVDAENKAAEGAARKEWVLNSPEGKADRFALSNLQTSASALRGQKVSDTVDLAALGIEPATCKRWIEIRFTPRKEGEAVPAEKTVSLYFGPSHDGEVPLLRREAGASDSVFWLEEDAVAGLFVPPADYIAEEAILAAARDVSHLRILDGANLLDAELKGDESSPGREWRLNAPTGKADAAALTTLLDRLSALNGRPAGALDRTQWELSLETNTRRMELAISDATGGRRNVLLRFGRVADSRVAVLRVEADGSEAAFWADAGELYWLFAWPQDYVDIGPYSGKVRHILITWKGKFAGAQPKDPQRTEEQARKLVQEILAKTAEAGADFVALQHQYNEDGQADAVYDVSPDARCADPFKKLGGRLKVGEVGWCETLSGIHVIKRIE